MFSSVETRRHWRDRFYMALMLALPARLEENNEIVFSLKRLSYPQVFHGGTYVPMSPSANDGYMIG